MKLRHKDKVKLARKMLSKMERLHHTSLFSSKNWLKRSEALKLKVKNKTKKHEAQV